MPENEIEADDNGVDDFVVDRSCIGCDNCGVGSPQKCCARCGSYYYCSKECQVQHWKQHKRTCTIIKEGYDHWKENTNNTLPDGSPLDTKEGPCAICLEETITNPVVLPCGHAFCFSCVGHYQWASKSESDEASCPYCRGEIPDVVDGAIDRGGLYFSRAFASSDGSEEQKKYAKLALAEFESGADLLEHEDAPIKAHLNELYIRARMMAMTDQPDETIKIMEEVLSLDEKYPGLLDRDQVALTKQCLAEAYSAIGKWKEAGSIYKSLVEESIVPNALTFIGSCQTFYETQYYDHAIEMGKIAFERFRCIPGVHKYVALSQKAKGDIEDAKRTMSRAILYEKHWDKDNLKKNKQILRELSSL